MVHRVYKLKIYFSHGLWGNLRDCMSFSVHGDTITSVGLMKVLLERGKDWRALI